MGAVVVFFVVWCIVGGVIGNLIGARKGNGTAGFWLGFFLGWIGWIIAAAMGSTIENDVARASAIATATHDATRGAITTTAYGVSSNTAARSLSSVTPVGARRVSLDALRATARPDPAWPDLEPSIRALETIAGAPPSVWFFADGLYNLMVRRDGVVLMCRDSEVRRASPKATVLYDVDDSGTAVNVNIDGFELTAPRPAPRVLEFLRLAQARQRRVVAAAAPPELAPPTVPLPEGRSVAAALDELGQLLDSGLVTADEYAAKRREILDRI